MFKLGKFLEAVAQGCSVKKMFLEIFQNLRKNTCVRVSFSIKLQALGALFATLNYLDYLNY